MRFIAYIDAIKHAKRIFIALAAAAVTFAAVAWFYNVTVGALYCWITFCFVILLFAWVTILAKHPKDTGIIASEQDGGYWLILLIIILTALTSLFAMLYLLNSKSTGVSGAFVVNLVQAMVAVFLSWLLIHTLFAIRYAGMYYTEAPGTTEEPKEYLRGLMFPGTDMPDFLDFAYFSFTLGMSFQVPDVNITTSQFRRLSLVHSFFSYIYSTAIIAISFNIISELISK